MNKPLPNKWVRKAVFDLIDGMTVDGLIIPFFDERVTGADIPAHFVLGTSQITDVDKDNKCEWFWESSILLDVVTSYEKFGNAGTKLLSENIAEEIRNLTQNIQLDVASNMEIITITQSFPSGIVTITENENVFRQFVRLELLIK